MKDSRIIQLANNLVNYSCNLKEGEKVLIEGKFINNCLIGLAKDKFSLNGENCILPNILKEILWKK